MNGNDVGVDVGGMSEAEEDHEGCKAEGCPNRCAFGDDCCHVGDGFAGCGGAGHVVGGVFHGCIAPVDQNKSEQSHTGFSP